MNKTRESTFGIRLGIRLKKIRESLGMKLNEASTRLGFSSYQILSSIEKGKREVKAVELLNFSKTYCCSISKLFDHGKQINVWKNCKLDQDLVKLFSLSDRKIAEMYKSKKYIMIAIRCLEKGLISRGKFAELMNIDDRNDINDFIAKRYLVETNY